MMQHWQISYNSLVESPCVVTIQQLRTLPWLGGD